MLSSKICVEIQRQVRVLLCDIFIVRHCYFATHQNKQLDNYHIIAPYDKLHKCNHEKSVSKFKDRCVSCYVMH